jgi:hypothetical protein
MCIVVSTGEQEVCKARTSEKAQLGRQGPAGPWNIRKSLYHSGKLDGNEATSTEKLLGFWGDNLWLSHRFLPPFC